MYYCMPSPGLCGHPHVEVIMISHTYKAWQFYVTLDSDYPKLKLPLREFIFQY